MSPIPRARNPGGFRPTSSGGATTGLGLDIDETEGVIPFGEVVGLVGGWEDKMRSATAWAVVNTTSAATPISPITMNMDEDMMLEEGRRSKDLDITG
jgi:hypothetical protein